jgi:hypothetical protein
MITDSEIQPYSYPLARLEAPSHHGIGEMTVQIEPSIEALNTNAPSLEPWHLQDTIRSRHEA